MPWAPPWGDQVLFFTAAVFCFPVSIGETPRPLGSAQSALSGGTYGGGELTLASWTELKSTLSSERKSFLAFVLLLYLGKRGIVYKKLASSFCKGFWTISSPGKRVDFCAASNWSSQTGPITRYIFISVESHPLSCGNLLLSCWNTKAKCKAVEKGKI